MIDLIYLDLITLRSCKLNQYYLGEILQMKES